MKTGETVRLGSSRYRILGAMPHSLSSYCTVWEAERADDGTPVVVKLPLREGNVTEVDPTAAQEHLWTELRFLARLRPAQNGHVVRMLDRGERDGLPVVVLEPPVSG